MKRQRRPKQSPFSAANQDRYISEALTDAYGFDKELSGFLTMIEDNLAPPLAIKILGQQTRITACEHGSKGVLWRNVDRWRTPWP